MSYSQTVQRLNPPAQTSLDDLLQAVREAGDERWYQTAMEIVRHLCESQDRFTTDQVWEHLEGKDVSTPEPRLMGAVMIDAAKSGWIRSTGQYLKSIRKECNRRPVTLWQSLLRPL